MKHAVAIVVFCACLASLTLAQGWGVNGPGKARRMMAATATTQPSWTNPNQSFLQYHWIMDTNFIRGTQAMFEASANTNHAIKARGSYSDRYYTNSYRTEKSIRLGYTYGNAIYLCSSNITCVNTTNYTLMSWIKLLSADKGGLNIGTRIIESDNVAGTRNIGLALQNTSNVMFQTYAGAYKTVYGTSTIPPNTWAHVAVTVTGTLASVYRDGVLEATGTVYSITEATGTMFGDYPYMYPFVTVTDREMADTHAYSRGLASNEVFAEWYNTPPTTNIGNGAGNIEVR